MSSFTTVVVGDQQIQFKTGGDSCDTYQLGDQVKWWVNPNYVGSCGLLDGVYEGWNAQGEWQVIIKNHILTAVRPLDPADRCAQQAALAKEYDIQDPPRELWTEAAWAQYEENEELLKEQAARDEAAGIGPFAAYTRQRMCEPGFFRQIFRDSAEPTELTRKDGVVLRVGETYQHFGRTVVLNRIYERDLVGVKHPRGTTKVLPAGELEVQSTSTGAVT